MAYKNDYDKSRKKEIEFEAYIKAKYNLLTENSSTAGYFADWDISTTATSHNNKITKFEVKYNSNYKKDKVIIETAKIIDEVKHPSGLSATQADYYVLTFEEPDTNFYLISVEKLKEMVASNKGKKEVNCDQAGYQLFIYDKKYFLQFCKII